MHLLASVWQTSCTSSYRAATSHIIQTGCVVAALESRSYVRRQQFVSGKENHAGRITQLAISRTALLCLVTDNMSRSIVKYSEYCRYKSPYRTGCLFAAVLFPTSTALPLANLVVCYGTDDYESCSNKDETAKFPGSNKDETAKIYGQSQTTSQYMIFD